MFFKDRKIVKDIIARAGRGDAEAEFELAKRYMIGKGVPCDIVKAVELYEDSAKHGYVKAQAELGNIYFNGIEDVVADKLVDRDYKKAAFWLEKAVENGAEVTEDICMQLGEIYKYGEYGGEADINKSAQWFQKPAEQGNIFAQNSLATCYCVLKDKENALLWAKKAAEQGSADELFLLGSVYSEFNDNENALKYYKEAAALGCEEAEKALEENS